MAKHITELNIKTFRGIRNLEIKNIGDFNILVGGNNCGKTSILEAIQIFSDPSEYNIINVARQRDRYSLFAKQGLDLFENFMYLFDISTDTQISNHYTLSISGTIKNIQYDVKVIGEIIERLMDVKEISRLKFAMSKKRSHGLVEQQEEVKTFIGKIAHHYCTNYEQSIINEEDNEIEINAYTMAIRSRRKEPIIKFFPIWTIDHLIGKSAEEIVKNKEILSKVVELLKLFDENISDLRYISSDDRFNLVIENNFRAYTPLSLYGDGMKKVLAIANAVVAAENGVLVIDEIETAIHTKFMSSVFAFLIKSCREMNVQLFATTHSEESLDKFLKCSVEEQINMRTISVIKKGEQTKAMVLDGEKAIFTKDQHGTELR